MSAQSENRPLSGLVSLDFSLLPPLLGAQNGRNASDGARVVTEPHLVLVVPVLNDQGPAAHNYSDKCDDEETS
jgi:hypothetical protein